jgi:signal peptidase I
MLILAALVLTFLIQTFLAKVYVIPSGSMETTLHGCDGCNNDRVIVDKISYRFSDPAPGDVVVFQGPDGWRNEEFHVQQADNWFARGLQGLGSLIGIAPADEKDFVKRVIAVGGQSVSCCDSQQRVLVDGIALNEPYVHYAESPGPTPQIKFGPVTIPQGSIWVMGDARDNSADSRVPGHGPVPVANVIGKARLIVMPFNRFGGIPDTNPQVVASGGPQATPGLPLAVVLIGALPLVQRRRRWLDRGSPDADWLDPRGGDRWIRGRRTAAAAGRGAGGG